MTTLFLRILFVDKKMTKIDGNLIKKEMGELKVILCQPKVALKYFVSTKEILRENLVWLVSQEDTIFITVNLLNKISLRV